MAVRLAFPLQVLGLRKGCEVVLGSDLEATQMGSSAAGG